MNVPNTQARDFDSAMRSCYMQSTMHLSQRTRTQLQNRLRATLAGKGRERHAHRPAWLLATACSLALVFGFGMQWHTGNQNPTATAPPVTQITAQETASAGQGMADNGELVATLDESPDLYLWLASDDAQSFATE